MNKLGPLVVVALLFAAGGCTRRSRSRRATHLLPAHRFRKVDRNIRPLPLWWNGEGTS